MNEPTKPPPAPPSKELAPSHLIVTEATPDYPRGAILPNASELAKSLAGKTRPATQHDLGVAGIMTRKA